MDIELVELSAISTIKNYIPQYTTPSQLKYKRDGLTSSIWVLKALLFHYYTTS